jgi:hypothetical protein
MIVGFSKHGKGGGRGPVQYLTSERNPDGSARIPPPTVLRGDPALTRNLIDSLGFTHKYTSGVLSFAPGEVITPEMEARIMDDFEAVAFAGLRRDQYSILWVRHEHAGHHELNFLVPRVELSSGKSLNIAPPKTSTRELFDTFRSMVNARYGLADPEDPARAQAVSLPHHIAKLLAAASRDGKPPALKGRSKLRHEIIEAVTEHVRREVDAGRIHNRDDVQTYLQRQGYAIARGKNKDYLTIVEPETGEHIRLKGGLYSEARFDPRQPGPTRYGTPDPERAAALAAKLEGFTGARARYHLERYGPRDSGGAVTQEIEGPTPPGPDMEPLEAYLERRLGDARIPPARHDDDEPPAPSTRRRQRRQRMQQASETIGRETDDVSGERAFERARAVGASIRRARGALAATLGRLGEATERWTAASTGLAGERAILNAASGSLIRTGRSFAGSLDAALEERWWARFYGRDDLEPER